MIYPPVNVAENETLLSDEELIFPPNIYIDSREQEAGYCPPDFSISFVNDLLNS